MMIETTSSPISSMSNYEIQRAKNIERNNKRLCSLGLMSEQEMEVSNRNAWNILDSRSTNSTNNETNRRYGIKDKQNVNATEQNVLFKSINKMKNENIRYTNGVPSSSNQMISLAPTRTSSRKRKSDSTSQNNSQDGISSTLLDTSNAEKKMMNDKITVSESRFERAKREGIWI